MAGNTFGYRIFDAALESLMQTVQDANGGRVMEVDENKVADRRFADTLGIMQPLGAIPEQEQAPA